MKATKSMENSPNLVYSSQVPVLCSALSEKKLGLTLEWDPWKQRVIDIYSNGILSVWKVENTGRKTMKYEFNLHKVLLTYLRNNTYISHPDTFPQQTEAGLHINLKTKQGHDTQFRLILQESEISLLYDALRIVSVEHNLDNLRQGSITEQVKVLTSEKHGSRHHSSDNNMSIMRRSIARAMDTYTTHSKKHRILAKRGTMRWLPVYMTNDLVHGAWWFVWGSVLFLISSIVVLVNAYSNNHTILGEDDSMLSSQSYRSSWVLMVISAIFCTLGSLAFVRAVHDEPPMPALCGWYHIHSDELLGSWLFLLAAIPIIPYTLIYISQSHGQVVYYVALAVAVMIVLGCLLFVRSCYPNENQVGGYGYEYGYGYGLYVCLFMCMYVNDVCICMYVCV
ncbi:hypothetical protein EON63_04950 [archaeon]|nr:MAG: hypothetical protein EON63_04950 [archaeon]